MSVSLSALRSEVLAKLTALEAVRGELISYIESVHSILNNEFMANRVAELNELEERICNLEHVYETENCTSCIADCLSDSESYKHHGSCYSCFYGVETYDEYSQFLQDMEMDDEDFTLCSHCDFHKPNEEFTDFPDMCYDCYGERIGDVANDEVISVEYYPMSESGSRTLHILFKTGRECSAWLDLVTDQFEFVSVNKIKIVE